MPRTLSSPIYRRGPRKSQEQKHVTNKSCRKMSTTINFVGLQRPPVGFGVFHTKGWRSRSAFPPEVRFLPSRPRENKRCPWDVPGILLGCPGLLGGVQKVCAKRVCAHVSAP